MQPRVPVPICSLLQGTQPFVGPLASPEMVSLRPELGVLSQLCFRDPDHFRAGMIHDSLPVWESLLADFHCSAVDFLKIVQDGIRIEDFFTPFKGDFKGQFYHAQTPPATMIHNAAICAQFTDFISDTIFSGSPLGYWQFGARSVMYLHPIWFFPLRLSHLSLVSAMINDF